MILESIHALCGLLLPLRSYIYHLCMVTCHWCLQQNFFSLFAPEPADFIIFAILVVLSVYPGILLYILSSGESTSFIFNRLSLPPSAKLMNSRNCYHRLGRPCFNLGICIAYYTVPPGIRMPGISTSGPYYQPEPETTRGISNQLVRGITSDSLQARSYMTT